MRKVLITACSLLGCLSLLVAQLGEDHATTRQTFRNSTGELETITSSSFDPNNLFFRDIGTNGRSCGTCHMASDAWSIAPTHIRSRFNSSAGQDPLFRTNDGSNCEGADVSSLHKAREAYSLLLNKGLIRVELALPADAEFSVLSVDDPYHCAPKPGSVSVYRRVLPATNLRFLSTVMWDGRESFTSNTLEQNLAHQVLDATLGHAQASVTPSESQIAEIVAFELATHTAQIRDRQAGNLNKSGAQGGPDNLSRQNFFIGINDPLGHNPTGAPFDPEAFTLFGNFGSGDEDSALACEDDRERACTRASIRRGEAIFNTRQFTIDNVAGLPRSIDSRHMHCLSRFAECWSSFSSRAAQPGTYRPVAPHAGPPAVYSLLRCDRRNGPNDGSRPRSHHGKMRRYRQIQGSHPARIGGSRALFPQRFSRRADGCDRVLQHALPDQPYAAR